MKYTKDDIKVGFTFFYDKKYQYEVLQLYRDGKECLMRNICSTWKGNYELEKLVELLNKGTYKEIKKEVVYEIY